MIIAANFILVLKIASKYYKKFIRFLIAIVSSLIFIQCTTDTIIGPAGADGALFYKSYIGRDNMYNYEKNEREENMCLVVHYMRNLAE